MIFILLYFIAELLLSIKVGITIGFGWSVVWVLGTTLLGALLLRLSPYAVMDTFNSIALNKLDLFSAQNAAISYILGAILLIIPGVLSDIFGIILLFYTLYLRYFATMSHKKNYTTYYKGEDDVIDAEIIECDDSNDTHSKRKF